MLEVLKTTDGLDASTQLFDLDYRQAIDALIAGEIDVAIVPQLDNSPLQRALDVPGVRLMSVAQAEAIAKTVPGLKHVELWRGLISLSRDIPNSDVDLLASRNRLLVRRDLHPVLQYLLLEPMRKVHRAPGPFNRLGEFPAEQANDLPLSPAAEAFYRSGPTLWQRYTSFWLTSLLNRIVFFVVPVIATLTSASRQSVHAAGMSDRLPFGRMTSTSNTLRRLMLLITASVWPSNAWRLRITVT